MVATCTYEMEKFTMPVDLKNIVFNILIVNVYWSEGITIVGKE